MHTYMEQQKSTHKTYTLLYVRLLVSAVDQKNYRFIKVEPHRFMKVR